MPLLTLPIEWTAAQLRGRAVGCQFLDPASGRFLFEGPWRPPQPGHPLEIELPAPDADYRIYVSPVSESGWGYQQGEKFWVVEASVRAGEVTARTIHTTLTSLRWRGWAKKLPSVLAEPWLLLWRQRVLIASLVRREVLARYRGTAGDFLWSFLHPLLLMLTYLFVFGVVLQARFPGDQSRTGFVLYFLAGMLPWLAFSEAAGRAANVILDNRLFVKKLVFPLETLPVNLTALGLVTSFTTLLLFLGLLGAARGGIPLAALALPVVLVPQILLTLGLCWWLAALGVFFRDLGQILGFVLTLWFFVTPICYPDQVLPGWSLPVLGKNPLYIIVRGYRALLLEGTGLEWIAMAKLWALSVLLFLSGHAFFRRTQRRFADWI
jgi:lipopolysaccharide transport system permease protein